MLGVPWNTVDLIWAIRVEVSVPLREVERRGRQGVTMIIDSSQDFGMLERATQHSQRAEWVQARFAAAAELVWAGSSHEGRQTGSAVHGRAMIYVRARLFSSSLCWHKATL